MRNRSTTMKITRTIATATALVASGMTGAVMGLHDASASVDPDDATNRYTFGEVMQTFPGQAQGNVEGQWTCDCHGYKIRSWVGSDGHDRKEVQYYDTDENSVFITYRREVVGGDVFWRTDRRMFATDGEGYYIPWNGGGVSAYRR